MKSAALALALAVISDPVFSQQVAPGELYEQAVQARLSGDNSRSAELLRQVVATDPANADAQLQLGYALLNLGDLVRAEAAFRRTLAIAPDYADARLGLARLEQRRGDRAAALAQLDLVRPGNAEAATLRGQISGMVKPVRWRVDVDGAYAFVDRGQVDWKEGSFRIAHQASAATVVSAGLELSRRFGLADTYGEVRAEHRFDDNEGSAYIFGGATPNSDFRPEWQIGLGGEVRLRSGPAATLLTLDVRQARYRVGDIQTLNPGIDQYLAGGRVWISGRWINIFDEDGRRQSGWLGRGDVLASDKLRLFAGAADAPDTSEGRVVDTFSLFSGFSWEVSELMTLRASLAHDDREIGSDRLQLGLGAGWKF